MRRVYALLVAMCCVLVAAGCAAAEAPLPDDVSVSAYQTRLDVAARVLEISVTNGSSEPLTVTGVRFESGQFAEPALWTKRDSTTIAPGRTVDLPVELGEPACEIESPRHQAVLEFTLPNGLSGTATLDVNDRLDRLPALRVEDCLGLEVAEIAALAIAEVPQITSIGGRDVAILEIGVEPTGSSGSVSIEAARGTTLLSMADPHSGQKVASLEVGVVASASTGSAVITIPILPNRCDPHAVSEDKRGTVIPLEVVLDDGTAGTLYLPSPEPVKLAFYAYVAEYCDFPD